MSFSMKLPKDMSNSLFLNELIPTEVPLHFNNINFFKLSSQYSDYKKLESGICELKQILLDLNYIDDKDILINKFSSRASKLYNKYVSLKTKRDTIFSNDINLKIFSEFINKENFKEHPSFIPYIYKIPKKSDGFRYLALVHPIGLLKAKNFIANN